MGHPQPHQLVRAPRRKPSSFFSLSCLSNSNAAFDYSPYSSDVCLVNEKSHNEESRYTAEYETRLYGIQSLASVPRPIHVYGSFNDIVPDEASVEYHAFLKAYPEYKLTWTLDALRRTDCVRLDILGETYVDYMGGAVYPESLVRVHTDFLSRSILGNTHSVSNSSRLSVKHAMEARSAVLSFFHAPPEYTVVFTHNATGAIKLVGESFPFDLNSTYVLGADSHNSLHGIRQFAAHTGSTVAYIPSQQQGGVDVSVAKNILLRNQPRSKDSDSGLFALTGQSNITNSKSSLSLISYAASLGYRTLLDGAALAPTSSISLADIQVDAMAISFYKMFGYPTGVGALIIKKSFLARLRRPWFAGGTVDVVQVPGSIVTRSAELHEQFEDGTINYLTLPAVTDGLRFLSAYMPFLPLRLSILTDYMVRSLKKLKHEFTGGPVVKILSRTPSHRPRSIGEPADTGSLVSCIFLSPSGEWLPNTFIEHAASQHNISLRTGCMCNPGGAAALLGIQGDMARLSPGISFKDFERQVGHQLGVVRISFGLASNFRDAWKVLQFAQRLASDRLRGEMYAHWVESEGVAIGQAL